MREQVATGFFLAASALTVYDFASRGTGQVA
jgi:hypothetical protein